MLMSALSVAGSFSRGAMLAAAAMALFLVWHSKSRFSVGAAVLLVSIGIFAFMPQSWTDRISTIRTYQDDGSALKRLNTWQFAWNFTLDHPVLGGGYNVFQSEEAYMRYAPRYDEGWIFQDAHSNYLKVLAEHGFFGLTLFLLIFVAAWRRARKAMQWSKGFSPGSEQHNLGVLAKMLQASIIAYMVGGSFLGLCYFDLPYNIVGLCVVLSTVAVQSSTTTSEVASITGTLEKKPSGSSPV
ncbi:MAG TPA: putative O-glycosylation ligase, exosortase A system-associated, partial [Steroidobacteraceae bacterium]|nr:putative O-glycosylation ligase, exosortase A system-associated [Steroidobacteraceae bacterium]